MSAGKTNVEINPGDLSDRQLLAMVVDGTFSRNKNFEFFKTKRGQELFKKARIIKGFMKDLENGAKITAESKENDSFLITIENSLEKYKRTVFMDELMYSVFSGKMQ
ncbi:MAG TPA: hypothetical protein ENN58_02360 [bacterium]|nr:hypothetical protein [bacterium]